MFHKLFLDHPRDLGESYFEHQHTAMGFAVQLLAAGFACAVHALVPGLFARTASRTIAGLNSRMTTGRGRALVLEHSTYSI